jgi:hypothetical protein
METNLNDIFILFENSAPFFDGEFYFYCNCATDLKVASVKNLMKLLKRKYPKNDYVIVKFARIDDDGQKSRNKKSN